jgi:hypothetical protein
LWGSCVYFLSEVELEVLVVDEEELSVLEDEEELLSAFDWPLPSPEEEFFAPPPLLA